MIVTLTANPSIDRTVTIDAPVTRGAVHRVSAPTDLAAGKGVNVSRVLRAAGVKSLAIFPAPRGHEYLAGIEAHGLTALATPADGVRTNLTITEADGTTTKFNQPGAALSATQLAALEDSLIEAAADADWVVLAGSLPPGVAPEWYASLVARLHDAGARVAVDTSGAPLAAFATAATMPDLMKPNAHELAELVGGNGDALEAAVAHGDFASVRDAAGRLVRRGVAMVLTTLGAAGALISTAEGDWFAASPPITPRSTVGAGDSSLAGFLIALSNGANAAEALRHAVASGSAATALAGTGVPTPADLDLDGTTVTPLD